MLIVVFIGVAFEPQTHSFTLSSYIALCAPRLASLLEALKFCMIPMAPEWQRPLQHYPFEATSPCPVAVLNDVRPESARDHFAAYG